MSLHDIFASVTGNEDLGTGVEEQIEATVEAVVEAQVTAEIAEAGEAVAEAEADIQKAEVAIEALEEKVEELEEVVEGMESMLSGATPFNAALFHDHYKRAAKISAKFGTPAEIHGVESFADASTASLNALAGLEDGESGFKATAAKAVAAVKKFFIDLYNGFINFFAGIFNKFKGIENRGKSLKAKLTAKEKLAEKAKLPKSAGWLKADGSAPAVGSVMESVVKQCQGAMNVDASGTPFSNLKAATETLKGLGTASQTADSDVSTTYKVVVEKGSFTVTVPKKPEGLANVAVTVGSPEGEGAEVAAPGKDKLQDLATKVMVEAKKLQLSKLDRKALEATRDATIAKLEKLAADQGADKKGQIAEYRNGTKGALKLQQGGLKVAGTILSAQLDFVAAFA